MATEVRHFTATIPAHTPVASPVVVDISFPPRVVVSIDWRVPPGPLGLMGWRLSMGKVQVIPTAGDPWVIDDGNSGTIYPSDQLSSGAWQVTGYNTGANPHSVYLAFHLDYPRPKPVEVQLVPAWLLGNAPDLAGLLPNGPKY